jgi:DNA-binding CsgD family transcriptional regulator
LDDSGNNLGPYAVRLTDASHIVEAFARSELRRTSLSSVWSDLAAGNCRIQFSFVTREYLGFVLEPSRPGPEHQGATYRRNVRILKSCLLLASQKLVADEFGLANSTVASAARHCMRVWGLNCRPAYAPTLLALAAWASEAAPIFVDECFGAHPKTGLYCRLLRTPRPENELEPLLTPAEFDVVSLLAEGYAHTELAELRRCSPRTVANQLASAFQRLKISGRGELLVRLAERAQRAPRVTTLPAA